MKRYSQMSSKKPHHLDVMIKYVPLAELKKHVKDLPLEEFSSWLRYCQENAGKGEKGHKCGSLHQDIANTLGEKLGFSVQFGDYKSGADGIWSFKSQNIVIESKTSPFWLKMEQVEGYIKDPSYSASCAVVISSNFTKGNRAAVKGGFPKIRLLTTDGLLKLVELSEKGVLSVEHIVNILSPQETVELDGLVDLIHGIIGLVEKESRIEAKPITEADIFDITDVPESIRNLGDVAKAMYIELKQEPDRWFEAEGISAKIAEDFAKTFAERQSPIGSGIAFSGIHLERRGLIEVESYQPEPSKYPNWFARKYKLKTSTG